jgi:hypothetical protein
MGKLQQLHSIRGYYFGYRCDTASKLHQCPVAFGLVAWTEVGHLHTAVSVQISAPYRCWFVGPHSTRRSRCQSNIVTRAFPLLQISGGPPARGAQDVTVTLFSCLPFWKPSCKGRGATGRPPAAELQRLRGDGGESRRGPPQASSFFLCPFLTSEVFLRFLRS